MIIGTDPASLLRLSRRANAWFSGASGLAFLVAANPIGVFLGLDAPWIIRALGIGLLLYALWLIMISRRPVLHSHEVWSAIALDGAWVFGSALMLIAGPIPLTLQGKWAVGIAADTVAMVAGLQMFGWFRYHAALLFADSEGSQQHY